MLGVGPCYKPSCYFEYYDKPVWYCLVLFWVLRWVCMVLFMLYFTLAIFLTDLYADKLCSWFKASSKCYNLLLWQKYCFAVIQVAIFCGVYQSLSQTDTLVKFQNIGRRWAGCASYPLDALNLNIIGLVRILLLTNTDHRSTSICMCLVTLVV